jgi:hypothetical protein
MTHITIEKEKLESVLEALESYSKSAYIKQAYPKRWVNGNKAITAIEEALAQPKQKPVAWKLVPIEPTREMLEAMDECSIEGYDERLYAGHAASVYMAALNEAPTPPQRKPLTDEEYSAFAETYTGADGLDCVDFGRAVARHYGIKE